MYETGYTDGCCVLDFWSIERSSTDGWRKNIAKERSNSKNEAGDDESLLGLAQRLPVSETVPEEVIAERVNPDDQQEITDDMTENIFENRTQDYNDNKNDVHQKKIMHLEGIISIEKTVEY